MGAPTMLQVPHTVLLVCSKSFSRLTYPCMQTTALFLLSRLFLWRGLYFKISNLGESVLPGGRGSTGARAKDI